METNNYDFGASTWNNLVDWYTSHFMEDTTYFEGYSFFLDQLSTNATVLEIGAGPGNCTRYLKLKRPDLNLIASDSSSEMMASLRTSLPNVKTLELDALKAVAQFECLDAVFMGFVLPYFQSDYRLSFFEQLKKRLIPSGIIYISFILGDPQLSGWKTNNLGNTLWMNYFTVESLKEELTEVGFLVIWEQEYTFTKPSGELEQQGVLVVQSE